MNGRPSPALDPPGGAGPGPIVIGAGPAGLTAAYEFARLGHLPQVFEQSELLGGISRTESYRGFRFDMGGHRFFTRSEEVSRLWHEVLGSDFLRRPRLSRIYYRGKFFYYPLRPLDALVGLGPLEALRILLSYLRWQVRPHAVEETFEQWVTNRFGRRLFETFFKTYTEKVWGLSCSELRAEWAAQRIKDLSVRSLLVSLFLKPGERIKTLIEEFHYPRLGPGMMWQSFATRVRQLGGQVETGSQVLSIQREGRTVSSVRVRDAQGAERTVPGSVFISSMPVTTLVARLDPAPPPEVLEAARRLRYRDFLTVCLIVDQPELFPDNWIYVHDAGVRVARIQNFKNWSPEMVPNPRQTSLGLEYFCNEGDETWTLPDAELVELARREIASIGLARAQDVSDGCVFRVPKSYPVYDAQYREHLAVVRGFVDGLTNLRSVGRNGLHRYNNQDHSMLTGLFAVRQLVWNEPHDLWSVNADLEYHEETREARRPPVDQLLVRALRLSLARVDPVAAGVALGVLLGLLLLLGTWLHLLASGPMANLALLGQYFPGYSVSALGSLIGLIYGLAAGFVLGAGFAHARNAIMPRCLKLWRWLADQVFLGTLLDDV